MHQITQHTELPAKLLDYFLSSDVSNIKQIMESTYIRLHVLIDSVTRCTVCA